VGILAATVIPTFNSVIKSAQIQINKSNMQTIKNAFMQYNQVNYINGNPHFPTVPENNLLDLEYKDLVLPDGRTPDNLFNGKEGLPYNSNGNPYTYYQENDTSSTGFITKQIIIKDEDADSPSYEEFVIGEF
jgi:type II secretory pathway pseudopilin PulG